VAGQWPAQHCCIRTWVRQSTTTKQRAYQEDHSVGNLSTLVSFTGSELTSRKARPPKIYIGQHTSHHLPELGAYREKSLLARGDRISPMTQTTMCPYTQDKKTMCSSARQCATVIMHVNTHSTHSSVAEIQAFLVTLVREFSCSVPEGRNIRTARPGFLVPMVIGEEDKGPQLRGHRPLIIQPPQTTLHTCGLSDSTWCTTCVISSSSRRHEYVNLP